MPKFVPLNIPEKKKSHIVLSYLMIILGLIAIVVTFFVDFQSKDFVRLIIAINVIWSGVKRLRKKKKNLFVGIDNEKISWMTDPNQESIFLVEWADIRWLKKEKKPGILIFRESSFSHFISLTCFSAEEIDQICDVMTEYASQKQIRLVNFGAQA